LPLTWIRQEHLDTLKALLPYITDRTAKRRVRETLLGLTTELTAQLMTQATGELAQDPVAPLLDSDLQDVERLLGKGVQHNGVVPELSAVQVGRALQVTSALLARAHIGAMTLGDQEELEWVFDVAADYDNGARRREVRNVEQLVRGGLGLTVRLSTVMPPQQPS